MKVKCILILCYIHTENCIDRVALAALPEDYEEFKTLVPQSGLRIKLKSVIKKYIYAPSTILVNEIIYACVLNESCVDILYYVDVH